MVREEGLSKEGSGSSSNEVHLKKQHLLDEIVQLRLSVLFSSSSQINRASAHGSSALSALVPERVTPAKHERARSKHANLAKVLGAASLSQCARNLMRGTLSDTS